MSVDQLRETIQGVNYKTTETEFEQSWITAVLVFVWYLK